MEQIINGVDVRGCDYILQDGSCEVQLALKRVNFECSQISDCYYKQLRRKEEECEELKKEIKECEELKLGIKNMLKLLDIEVDIDNIKWDDIYEKMKEINKFPSEIMENLSKKYIELEEENKSYNQALDEIEKQVNKCDNCPNNECGTCINLSDYILQIIQKVKENEQ